MKTILITIACLLLSGHFLLAQQARFTSSGSIDFEKTSNMNALFKKLYGNMQGSIQQALEQYQKTQPQFKVVKSTLVFSNDKTLYTPIAESLISNTLNTPMSDQLNTVYTDLAANTTTLQKNISDAFFLVKDSVRKIKWKITDETRVIAGYPCRRANGLVLDSIYVVAFYTDKITVSGGPESFSGLPGMILEVALPHENVTWVAKKVTDVQIAPATITPPKKGKVVNNKQMYDFIKNLLGTRADAAQLSFLMKSYLL